MRNILSSALQTHQLLQTTMNNLMVLAVLVAVLFSVALSQQVLEPVAAAAEPLESVEDLEGSEDLLKLFFKKLFKKEQKYGGYGYGGYGHGGYGYGGYGGYRGYGYPAYGPGYGYRGGFW